MHGGCVIGWTRLDGRVLRRRGLCLHLGEPWRRARYDRSLHAEKLPPPSVELSGTNRVFAGDFSRRQAWPKALGDNLALLLQAPSPTLAVGDNLNTVATSTPMTARTSALIDLGCWQNVVHRQLASRRRSAPPCAAVAPLTDKGAAIRDSDVDAREAARQRVDVAKVGLGERGPVWWTDGAPDFNRHMVRNTPYAAWFFGKE